MMIQTATSAIAIPAEVLAFAAAQGVSAELPAVVAMTQRVFPEARLRVFLEDDPEIADDWHIIVEAQGLMGSVDDLVQARAEWVRSLFLCCSAPKVCVFRLGMEMAP
jgi:hypothetical protein